MQGQQVNYYGCCACRHIWTVSKQDGARSQPVGWACVVLYERLSDARLRHSEGRASRAFTAHASQAGPSLCSPTDAIRERDTAQKAQSLPREHCPHRQFRRALDIEREEDRWQTANAALNGIRLQLRRAF